MTGKSDLPGVSTLAGTAGEGTGARHSAIRLAVGDGLSGAPVVGAVEGCGQPEASRNDVVAVFNHVFSLPSLPSPFAFVSVCFWLWLFLSVLLPLPVRLSPPVLAWQGTDLMHNHVLADDEQPGLEPAGRRSSLSRVEPSDLSEDSDYDSIWTAHSCRMGSASRKSCCSYIAHQN